MAVIQPTDKAELREALRTLIARPDGSPADADHQIDLLFHYVEQRGLQLDHCLLAKSGGRTVAVCLCIDSPGRTASVFIPAANPGDVASDALVTLLREASRRAQHRDIQLLQALIQPQARQEANIYKQAGFTFLAQLIDLETDLTQPVLTGKPAPPVTWETYGPDTHRLFADVIEQTYQDSLDCGSLNGLRDIEDILATHQATGLFDPRSWFVARANGHPVGAILIARACDGPSCEVVYMGVLPQYRKRGYGAALLRHGVNTARDQAALTLTLAVDARNMPAQHLYHRFGFHEVARRDAWICISPPR